LDRNQGRKSSSPNNSYASIPHRSGTVEGAAAAVLRQNPRVARSLGFDGITTNNNTHPGITQSDTESSSPRARPAMVVGVVTSPLALRRSRKTTTTTNNEGAASKTVQIATPVRPDTDRDRLASTNKRAFHIVGGGARCSSLSFSQSSTEDDSEDTMSMRSAGFGEYLKILSVCPHLSDSSAPSSRVASPMGRGNPAVPQVITVRRRLCSTTSECEDYSGKKRNFRVSEPVTNFPGCRTALRSQMSLPLGTGPYKGLMKDTDEDLYDISVRRVLTSDSSGADTMVSDISFDDSGTISEDSLNNRSFAAELDLSRRLKEIAASMETAAATYYETDTSEASSLYVPQPRRPPFRRKRKRGLEVAAMEEELKGLERRLAVAEKEGQHTPRARWEDAGFVGVKSLSTELFGNYTDNEKVNFSYENLNRQLACVEEVLSMPLPVESVIKKMHPMRCNAPHERYSPKPVRKAMSKKKNSSSPSTPTTEGCPLRPFGWRPPPPSSSVVVRYEESVSMPAMGVTSMWIPSAPPAARRANFTQLSKKVLRQTECGEVLLPSKAEIGDGTTHGRIERYFV
jgi:hypothetical protein